MVLNGKTSLWSNVLSGVPQGSVLGPTLFVIFINLIDEVMATVTAIISKFADDTKIGKVVDSEVDCHKLQDDINKLLKWSSIWLMQFNDTKCKVMHIGRNNPHHEYSMGNHTLEAVDCEKDIGVMVHHSLKPSTQCAKAATKGNQVLGQMARAFHFRDSVNWIQLYTKYVRPHLEYCVQAWSPWKVTDIDLLEAVQKRAVRMVSGLHGLTYEEKLKELKLPSLVARRKRGDMLQVWKVLNGDVDVDPSKLFLLSSEASVKITRHTSALSNLAPRSFKLDIRKNFFSVRSVNSWNNLPVSIRASSTTDEFKALYDEYVLK